MLPGVSGSLITASFLQKAVLDDSVSNLVDARTLRQVHRWWKRVERVCGPATSVRALTDVAALPLFDILGYRALQLEPQGNGFTGVLTRSGTDRVAVRISSWDTNPDSAWRDAVRAGRTAGSKWGLIFTGRRLCLVDARRTWSRRALQFELPIALNDDNSALAFLTLVPAADALSRDIPLDDFVTQSDAHGLAVCASLGEGVLEALAALLTALDANMRGTSKAAARQVFEQAVTIVYRLLFLLFAEARSLVPTWHHVYRESYTIEALCRRFVSQPTRRGAWQTLQAISRLAHRGCHAGDLVVTPFNGRLFSPRHAPLAERARVSDAIVGTAVLALATTRGTRGQARERIAYADLGVEQLGAVYERVLEYEPSRTAGTLRLARTSRERKSTGSFYTPRAMTDFLVRRALHPLVAGRTAEEILQLRVLDPAMGSGAFLVAACRYLGDAVLQARIAEGAVRAEPTREERAAIRRVIAQRCLFGVDLNPMAVQLARLSLWRATLATARPLTFLDHHLAAGDSLTGAALTDLTRRPGVRRGDSRRLDTSLPLFDSGDDLSRAVLPARFRIATEPADTLPQVREKERALAALTAPGTPLSRLKQAADLWCAASFWGDSGLSAGVYADLLGSLTGGRATLAARHSDHVLQRAGTISATHHFFHWELEFPEVFFTDDGRRDPRGGFDVVIGNPPWDVLRADTGTQAERERSRRDGTAHVRFFRESRIYQHQSGGHANRYQLFLERALQLTRPAGRIAMIVPSGLATDHGSAPLRRELFNSVQIDRLIGFDNRHAIFPIHRDVKFLLLTGTKGASTERLTCTFGQTQAAWLDQLPDAAADDPPSARVIVLPRSLIERWDPAHLALPLLPRAIDLAVLSSVTSTIPMLSDSQGWAMTFGRELNATEDRPHFVSRDTRYARDLLTIVQGKHLEPFRLMSHASALAIRAKDAASLVDANRTFLRSRLAYRDVASATNRLTLIAARLPVGVISTHTVFCSKTALGDEAQYCLLALLNSLVANYLVRLQVTTHVTTALMARLPVPRPAAASSDFRELASLARSLERTGVAGHDDSYARVNTIAARLYGLSHPHYEHVVSTFPLLSQDLRTLCIGDHKRATETQRAQRHTPS